MLLSCLLACAASRGPTPASEPTEPPPEPPARTAEARLEPRSGGTVTGSVRFSEREGHPVKVKIDLAGASPGDHAVHVHERGDCSAPDATSAGSHFNPAGTPHGDVHAPAKHPGDFGNVTVGADGTGRAELEVTSITLGEGMSSVEGLAVIVHERPDDFSQPAGNAGARQACGIVVVD